MHVVPMEPKKNIETMLSAIELAKKQNVDVVVFPELCISGYLLSDQWLNRQFWRETMALHQRLLNASCAGAQKNKDKKNYITLLIVSTIAILEFNNSSYGVFNIHL